jgi:hypothetical protein
MLKIASAGKQSAKHVRERYLTIGLTCAVGVRENAGIGNSGEIGPGPNILWHNFIRVRIITTDHHTLGVFERPALLPASAVRAPQATKCRTEVLLMLSDSTNPFVRPRYTIPAAP